MKIAQNVTAGLQSDGYIPPTKSFYNKNTHFPDIREVCVLLKNYPKSEAYTCLYEWSFKFHGCLYVIMVYLDLFISVSAGNKDRAYGFYLHPGYKVIITV